MSKHVTIPAVVKNELLSIAEGAKYVEVVDILSRGQEGELLLNNQDEAQAIVNVARVSLLDTLLKNPYWDDSLDNYSEEHEENFQEVQMGLFEKTIFYIGQEFDIESKV